MKKILAAVAIAALVGCASTGVQVKDEHLNEMKAGETTQADVLSRFGKPTTSMRNSDGTRTLMYVYAESRTRASTFIPFVGAFVGGVDTNSTSVMFRFDKEGKLIDYTSSESEMGTATGIAVDAEPVENQPRKQ